MGEQDKEWPTKVRIYLEDERGRVLQSDDGKMAGKMIDVFNGEYVLVRPSDICRVND